MSKIATKTLSFVAGAGGPVAYRIRIEAPNTAPSYDTAYDEVPVAETTVVSGRTRITLNTLPSFQDLDGARDVHVTAVDAAGNESDFLEIDNYVFDFSPPAAPTAGQIG